MKPNPRFSALFILCSVVLFHASNALAVDTTGFGSEKTRIGSCDQAKHVAERKCPATVDYYSSCDCESNKAADDSVLWECSVEATCTAVSKEEDSDERRSDSDSDGDEVIPDEG